MKLFRWLHITHISYEYDWILTENGMNKDMDFSISFLKLMLPITSNFTIHSNKNISIKVVKLNINARHYLVHSRIFLCVCVSSLHHAKEEVKERYKKTKAFISVYLIIDKRYDFYLVACHSVQKN